MRNVENSLLFLDDFSIGTVVGALQTDVGELQSDGATIAQLIDAHQWGMRAPDSLT